MSINTSNYFDSQFFTVGASKLLTKFQDFKQQTIQNASTFTNNSWQLIVNNSPEISGLRLKDIQSHIENSSKTQFALISTSTAVASIATVCILWQACYSTPKNQTSFNSFSQAPTTCPTTPPNSQTFAQNTSFIKPGPVPPIFKPSEQDLSVNAPLQSFSELTCQSDAHSIFNKPTSSPVETLFITKSTQSNMYDEALKVLKKQGKPFSTTPSHQEHVLAPITSSDSLCHPLEVEDTKSLALPSKDELQAILARLKNDAMSARFFLTHDFMGPQVSNRLNGFTITPTNKNQVIDYATQMFSLDKPGAFNLSKLGRANIFTSSADSVEHFFYALRLVKEKLGKDHFETFCFIYKNVKESDVFDTLRPEDLNLLEKARQSLTLFSSSKEQPEHELKRIGKVKELLNSPHTSDWIRYLGQDYDDYCKRQTKISAAS